MSKKTRASFFQRIGKYIILFVSLGIVATILTAVTVTVAHYYGDDLEVGAGIYFNFNVFITLMMGFLVTPIVILFVTKQREKVNKAMSNKAMSQKAKRNSVIIGIAALGIFLLLFFVVVPSATTQQRFNKSNIGSDEIVALKTDYETGSMIGVPFLGQGWLFYQLDIDNDVLAQKLMLPSVVLPNGTHVVVQMDNAYTMPGSTVLGTTFVFFYLESWWFRDYAIPSKDVSGHDVAANETLSAILEIAH